MLLTGFEPLDANYMFEEAISYNGVMVCVKEEVVKHRIFVLSLIFGVALALTACASAPPAAVEPVKIEGGVQHVTYVSGAGAEEYRFLPADLTLDAGQVLITYQNNGVIEHELMVLDASDPGEIEELLAAHESGSEEGGEGEMGEHEGEPSILMVPELEDVESGTSQTTEVFELAAGSYEIACMKPGHYQKGMHTSLVVQ